jgi:hypothetical protein
MKRELTEEEKEKVEVLFKKKDMYGLYLKQSKPKIKKERESE